MNTLDTESWGSFYNLTITVDTITCDQQAIEPGFCKHKPVCEFYLGR